jgi:hypothetical protein
MNPVFEWAKTVHALARSAIVIAPTRSTISLSNHLSHMTDIHLPQKNPQELSYQIRKVKYKYKTVSLVP